VDELYQETSIRAFRSLGNLERPDRFRGWILRIAYNTSVDWIRRRQAHRRNRCLEGELTDPSRIPHREDADAPNPEMYLPYLVEEIARLKPKHAAAVLLRGLEGLTYREIAAHLNISLPCVKIYLFRARHCLRNRMATVTVEDSVIRQFVVPPVD
jgi:RNA polymerase sigma-70 factor (ECF subfamily)